MYQVFGDIMKREQKIVRCVCVFLVWVSVGLDFWTFWRFRLGWWLFVLNRLYFIIYFKFGCNLFVYKNLLRSGFLRWKSEFEVPLDSGEVYLSKCIFKSSVTKTGRSKKPIFTLFDWTVLTEKSSSGIPSQFIKMGFKEW